MLSEPRNWGTRISWNCGGPGQEKLEPWKRRNLRPRELVQKYPGFSLFILFLPHFSLAKPRKKSADMRGWEMKTPRTSLSPDHGTGSPIDERRGTDNRWI